MPDDKEIKDVIRREKRSEKSGKYKPLPRNRQTEREIAEIFERGTERELMQFLRENGLNDDAPRFVEILKLFREHGGKQR
jgi:hypothetical protein